MATFPPAIQRMVELYNRLPGIGTKTSERFVFFLLRQSRDRLTDMISGLTALRDTVQTCSRCFNYSENTLCPFCADSRRDQSIICVVAETPDVYAIEHTGEFTGVYHVLGGVVNQIEGMTPDQIRIAELVERVKLGGVQEVILATNPDIEGETTASIIAQSLQGLPVQMTRIARGLPTGADIEYADSVTLTNALTGRTKLP